MGGDAGGEGHDARGRVSAWIEVGVVDADTASTAPAGTQGGCRDGRELGPGEPAGSSGVGGRVAGRELAAREHVEIDVQPPPVSAPGKVLCRIGRDARGVTAQLLERVQPNLARDGGHADLPAVEVVALT